MTAAFGEAGLWVTVVSLPARGRPPQAAARRAGLEAAIQAGALLRNPAAGVRVPRGRSREMHFLSAAEVERLAEAIVPPYGLLVRFAAYTGLRAGELAALRIKRLDLLRGTVRVVESASEVGGRLVLGSTKTYAERTVRLPRFLRDELAVYLAGRPATWMGSCSWRPGVDRYGHLFPDAPEHLADRLDAARAAAQTDPARTQRHDAVVELPTRQAQNRA